MIYERPMSPPRSSLFRPAAFGLSGGMILGAIYLAVKAVHLASADCGQPMSAEECVLDREIAFAACRLFGFSAFGLLLVGAGVLMLSRPKKEGVP